MKKMFTLIMTLLAFSALFAQRDKPYGDDCNVSVFNNSEHSGNDMNRRPEHGVEMQRDNGRWQNNAPMNHDNWVGRRNGGNEVGDRRKNDDHNDSHMNGWNRERSSDQLRRQRSYKLKAFGGGILLGGVLGVIIGTQR